MGCTKIGHCHQWPTSGTLVIQRCEIRCNFCHGELARKDWKYAWFLRRHVRAVHVKRGKYPALEVDIGWDEKAPKGTKENPRPVTKKGGVTVKSEFPNGFVQPFDNGEHFGQLPGAPNGFSGYGADPLAMSVSAVQFRTEDAVLLETHRSNTVEDFEGYLKYMVDTADIDDEIEGEANLSSIRSVDDTIDPALTQTHTDQTNPNDFAADLMADDEDTMVFPEPKHTYPDADLASAKLFMADYNTLREEAMDEMPLTNISANDFHSEHPDFDAYWNLFSDSVNQTADQMRAEGVDVGAVQHMLPAMTLFARSLQESALK